MPVALFANPRSGSGRAARLADHAEHALRAAGHTVNRFAVGPGLPHVDMTAAVAGASVAIAAGGDGTVRSVAAACIAAGGGVPLYHLPSGNENLFAREFGMDRDPATLIAALRRGRVTRCDVGAYTRGPSSGDGLFLLMASIGPDASVCHRLQATRTKGVGHRAYVGPIYQEFQQPAISRVRIWTDGIPGPVAEGRGMVVVANCRQYGMRIDPCHRASMADGLFDLAFIPADTAIDAFVTLARLRFKMPAPDVVRATASRIRIESSTDARIQVDGEPEEWQTPHTPQQAVEFAVRERILPVLDAR